MRRNIPQKILEAFKRDLLFTRKIKSDCEKQKVFFAIRGNKLDIYYKGGRLFSFDKKGFKTHFKYASLISKKWGDYLTEEELSAIKLTKDFDSNYSRIKENCSKYSGKEALGVSAMYHRDSYISGKDIVVLDIEVSFESFEDDKNQDRIDIVLFNKVSQTLQFVEAKHYSNSEIWAKLDSDAGPKVINQIKRYEKQIKERRDEIIQEYSAYIAILNDMFALSLPAPKKVEDEVILLIFGFDRDQKSGRLAKYVTKNPKFTGLKVHPVGGETNINLEHLWKVESIKI